MFIIYNISYVYVYTVSRYVCSEYIYIHNWISFSTENEQKPIICNKMDPEDILWSEMSQT